MTKAQIVCWLGAVLLLLAWGQVGQAQTVGLQDPCRHTKANELGTARADQTISTTPVQVVPTSGKLCGALILNTSATQAVRCAGVNDGMPSATAGFFLRPGAVLQLGLESQDGWNCIRDTSSTGNATTSTITLYQ